MNLKLRISILLFVLTICYSTISIGQIPDSLKSDWSRAGIDSFFTFPTATIDILNYGAIPNDGLNDITALQTAIFNMPTAGAVILFPAGIFNFSSSINLPSNCMIKGSGSDSTFFVFDFGGAVGNCFNLIGSGSANHMPILNTLVKGSNIVQVQNASVNLTIGDRIEIFEQNGAWDIVPAAWATNCVGHISTVDSIWGDSIRLAEPVRIDFDLSLNPIIHKLQCVENSGVQCLKITRIDSIAPSINYGIYFYNAFNCIVSRVESYKSIGAHIWAEASAHLTIERNYFHHAYTYDGSNTRGYGVVLAVHTCLSRIENNIFKTLRHSMMVKQGANGNVFAYNYSVDPNRSEFPSNYGADICLHGHYPFANLFEGNINQNTAIDQAYGPSGPGNTFFRNRTELYGFIMTSGSVQSNGQVIVGNDITSMTLFQGQYITVGSGHFEFANRVKGVVTPSGATTLTDTSLYLSSKPNYWINSLSWPSNGMPVVQTANQVPAAQRCNSAGILAPCENSIDSSSVGLNSLDHDMIKCYYKNGNFTIDLNGLILKNGSLILYDVEGREIFRKRLSNNQALISENIPNLKTGMYLGKVNSDRQSFKFKLSVTD